MKERYLLMYKFDSDAFIKEMEELGGVEETPIDYEEYETYMYYKDKEQITERDLKGDM